VNYVTIKIDSKEIKLDREDYSSLPKGYYFKFDKDGYAILYFNCKETRREENVRLSRWVLHNPKDLLVDHINGERLDNRKENLRAVTSKQNAQNRKPRKNSSSKYKGVVFDKKSGKYQAQIKVDGKSKYLGQYEKEEAAARAYDKASRDEWGAYAYQNFNIVSP
jgi:hypothetical protein